MRPPLRIVVAPDKFKGTLSAAAAARAMAEGALAVFPSVDITVFPMSDGGEGFLGALLSSGGGELLNVVVRGPLGGRTTASLAYLGDGRVGLESAQACGLDVEPERRPLDATSAGVGDLIRHALDAPEPRSIVVGLGGTASTDGGTGAAAALGWRFLDSDGCELGPGGGELARLHAVDGVRVDRRLESCSIVAACDVGNPLVGERGSATVFAPQKGASRAEVTMLARGLERLVEVVRSELGRDIADVVHGGAGGGLGAGLHAFLGAELVSGFDYVAGRTALAGAIERADVVLTGEGRVDVTTGAGKVVSGVVGLAKEAGARAIVIAGEIAADAIPGFDADVTTVGLVERVGDDAWTRPAAAVTDATAEVLTTAIRG